MRLPRFLGPALLSLFLAAAAGALTFDEWRAAHFSAAELADPAISGEGANPTGDGFSNLLKYAFDLDPHLADAAPGLRLTTHEGPLALDFR